MEPLLIQLFREGLSGLLPNSENDRILLTVSGGIDSMVMMQLFYRVSLDCEVAHCNFKLRGEDSDKDEQLVREMAASLDFPLHVKHFDVPAYMDEKGVSLQMAARELRYNWFNELGKQLGTSAIATAHNLNDSIETFFLNLGRGTGIRGLTGIPAKQGNIIRPLLQVSRQQIEDFSREEKVRFREDASNQSTLYQRNKIRHELIPLMEKLNPGFLLTMKENMSHLEESRSLLEGQLEELRKKVFRKSGEGFLVSRRELLGLHPLSSWIYELFSPFGFGKAQCNDIEGVLHRNRSGKRFVSASHQLYADREEWILMTNEAPGPEWERYYLDRPEHASQLPFSLDVEVLERSKLEKIPSSARIACLDLDELEFPLVVRHWQHGDYFYPLGMEEMKKLSDFFVDEKIPVPVKEGVWILASGRRIVWIMGLRIDNRFRITNTTTRVLCLRLQSDVLS